MNKSNISYTRNHLSELIDRVREGETVLIMDRNRPVAQLAPVAGAGAGENEWRDSQTRRGLIRPATRRMDPKALRTLPECRGAKGGDLLEALIADRGEGR